MWSIYYLKQQLENYGPPNPALCLTCELRMDFVFYNDAKKIKSNILWHVKII